MPTCYLTSFFHSGNHFLRCCLEFLTGQETFGVNYPKDTPIIQRNETAKTLLKTLEKMETDIVFQKIHDSEKLVDDGKNIMIFITRHPAEAISSIEKVNWRAKIPSKTKNYSVAEFAKEFHGYGESFKNNCKNYLDLHTSFTHWSGPKIHIYYEPLTNKNFDMNFWLPITNLLKIPQERLYSLESIYSQIFNLGKTVLFNSPETPDGDHNYYRKLFPWAAEWTRHLEYIHLT